MNIPVKKMKDKNPRINPALLRSMGNNLSEMVPIYNKQTRPKIKANQTMYLRILLIFFTQFNYLSDDYDHSNQHSDE